MLNPEVYRQAIRVQGEQITWLKAMPCDCYDPGTNYDQQRGCTKCLFGYIYREQELTSGVKALVTQVRRSFLHPDLGWVLEGELICTTMPDEIALGPMDRVVLLQREMTARERIVKGTDSLTHGDLAGVVEVSDSSGIYEAGTDYTVNLATGKISWLPGAQAPAEGAIYAVEYQYHPVFWYLSGELTVPRPTPLTETRLPQRGKLTYKGPGEA